MTNEEVLEFYDEYWNEYAKVSDMLHDLLDEHDKKIADLEKRLTESYMKSGVDEKDESKKVKELEALLLECQDRLDEETHSS